MFHTFERISRPNVSRKGGKCVENISVRYPCYSFQFTWTFGSSILQHFLLLAFEIRTELALNGRKSFLDIINIIK